MRQGPAGRSGPGALWGNRLVLDILDAADGAGFLVVYLGHHHLFGRGAEGVGAVHVGTV